MNCGCFSKEKAWVSTLEAKGDEIPSHSKPDRVLSPSDASKFHYTIKRSLTSISRYKDLIAYPNHLLHLCSSPMRLRQGQNHQESLPKLLLRSNSFFAKKTPWLYKRRTERNEFKCSWCREIASLKLDL